MIVEAIYNILCVIYLGGYEIVVFGCFLIFQLPLKQKQNRIFLQIYLTVEEQK